MVASGSATAMPMWFRPSITSAISAASYSQPGERQIDPQDDDRRARHGDRPAEEGQLQHQVDALLHQPQRAAGDDPAALEADDHGRLADSRLRLPGDDVAGADRSVVE